MQVQIHSFGLGFDLGMNFSIVSVWSRFKTGFGRSLPGMITMPMKWSYDSYIIICALSPEKRYNNQLKLSNNYL